MKTERQIRHVLKLRLLALVLALALTWYALNPAPGPARRGQRRPEGEPDEKRREEQSRVGGRVPVDAGLGRASGHVSPARSRAADEVEALDWPEYISLD